MGKLVAVNATAAINSGALTIIKLFLHEIEKSKIETIVFCCTDLSSFDSNTTKIIQLPKKGYLNRIVWDYFKFRQYLDNGGFKPSIIVSFQNTGLLYDKTIPQLIYYHNPIPFSKKKWNPFKNNERIIWFYQKIYPFFIRRLIRNNTFFIVQAEWIKESFVKKFHVDERNVKVIKPTIEINTKKNKIEIKSHAESLLLIYPATAFVYKNHKLILKTMGHLKKTNLVLFNKITVIFTIELQDVSKLKLMGFYMDVSEKIKLMGYLSEDTLFNLYLKADAILYPSIIETFGLPLKEASIFNKPIFCANEIYAYETLNGYENVKFLDSENYKLWAMELEKFAQGEAFCSKKSGNRELNYNSWEMATSFIQEILSNKI